SQTENARQRAHDASCFFFKQKTAYEFGLGIPAEPLFRSSHLSYQAGLRRDAVQPDIEAERKKRDEIEAGKSYCSRRFGGATCDRSEERRVGKECTHPRTPSHVRIKQPPEAGSEHPTPRRA